MTEYHETKENYEKGIAWHIQKSFLYNWNNQIDWFVRELQGKRVLDAGCGGGRDVKKFLKKGLSVDGIDYSRNAIEKCRQDYPEATFYEEDLLAIDLPNGEYNGIWACASLVNFKKEHAITVVSTFKRILKPNGILFISVKEGKGERVVYDKAGQRFFRFYSLQEITELIGKTGFTIIRKEAISDAELTGKLFDSSKPAWICIFAANRSFTQ